MNCADMSHKKFAFSSLFSQGSLFFFQAASRNGHDDGFLKLSGVMVYFPGVCLYLYHLQFPCVERICFTSAVDTTYAFFF